MSVLLAREEEGARAEEKAGSPLLSTRRVRLSKVPFILPDTRFFFINYSKFINILCIALQYYRYNFINLFHFHFT